MTESVGEMWSKYKELGGLNDPDYPKNEQVFSWNRDSPFIRPEVYRCANCNHSLVGRERCDGRKCDKCGYPIKLYGYPDLVHDTFFDMNEVPYEFDENGYHGYYTDTHNEYRGVDQNLPIMTEDESANEYGYEHGYAPEKHNERQMSQEPAQEPTQKPTLDATLPKNYSEVKDDKVENLDVHETFESVFLCGFVVGRLVLFVIALLVASYRGELKKCGSNDVNWSLVACVFLFPDIYFAYAIFEWLVRPKC